jgi:Flp pilus assembly protein TadG
VILAARRGLWRDRRGTTILEFAFILPPFLFLLMGGSEVVYQVYVQSILDGAIQKAARDSAIQGGAQRSDELDNKVLSMVRVVAKSATIESSTRRSYATFSDIKPERFTDTNGNNVYDANECFEDVNGNKRWDADAGKVGQGGANDVTLYTLKLRYVRLFPVAAMLGWGQQSVLSASTLLKNQPYASQTVTAAEPICP